MNRDRTESYGHDNRIPLSGVPVNITFIPVDIETGQELPETESTTCTFTGSPAVPQIGHVIRLHENSAARYWRVRRVVWSFPPDPDYAEKFGMHITVHVYPDTTPEESA